jgi:hypothetical protein
MLEKPKKKAKKSPGLSVDDKKLMKQNRSLGAERLAMMFKCSIHEAKRVIGSS